MFAVDVGGTFTDVVAVRDGRIETTKVSTDYAAVHGSVVEGARTLGLEDARVFNHASTHGLNAVITRNLPKIGVLCTDGHRDVLDHGRVARPGDATLNPHWRRPFGDATRPLVQRYLRRPITERVLADGSVLFPLDEEQARAEIEVLARCNVDGVAITLMNSYVNGDHERRLLELVHEILGDDIPVSVSSAISPLAQEYTRASTTVIDAFMKIIFSEYISALDDGLRGAGFDGSLNFADCAASLVPATSAMQQPFRLVFAGPAAGAVASAHFGELMDETNLICADVGGTSCDISLVRGGSPQVKTTFTLEHDLIVNALAVDVTAIGAGGGSLVTVGPAGEIRVGPGSAGSTPGPASYRKGGTQPTTTDTCLLAGIIDPGSFADGEISLYTEDAEAAFDALPASMDRSEKIKEAYAIGVHNLAEGIFNVVIQNGVDPRDFTLVAYGAAGPMLLPAALDLVKCKRVVIPPHPGLFSAIGLLAAEQKFGLSRSAYTMLGPEAARGMNAIFEDMERELFAALPDDVDVTVERTFDGRVVGQSWDTPFIHVPAGVIDEAAIEAMVENFHTSYHALTNSELRHLPVEGVTYRVQATVAGDKVSFPTLPERSSGSAQPVGSATISHIYDAPVEADVYERHDLLSGDRIAGPAIIREALSTTYLGPDQVATVGWHGEISIEKAS
jgi:N-methylhydantoinase A